MKEIRNLVALALTFFATSIHAADVKQDGNIVTINIPRTNTSVLSPSEGERTKVIRLEVINDHIIKRLPRRTATP